MLASVLLAADEVGRITTHSSWRPENFEIIFGGLASILVIGALFKVAPGDIPGIRGWKKSLQVRTERIGKELLQAANNKQNSINLAETIRADKGDIGAERARMLAEADQTAARVLEDGRARVERELADTEAKAVADIEAGQGRLTAELQGRVAALASAATEHVVTGSLDHATQVSLIEDFIAKVGAGR